MKIDIVIPAHNEEDHIIQTLDSLIHQTVLPRRIVVVNDHSSDRTKELVQEFATENPIILLVNNTSSDLHVPGNKVINAFYKGFEALDHDYDIICKFDGDIILPEDYFEKLTQLFNTNKGVGIAGGLLLIERNGKWIYENIASKDHIRGPIKAYRKACFEDIDGIRRVIGWDTIDVLLAKFHGWETKTDKSLYVKHLKSTGSNYSKQFMNLNGERWFNMRYGLVLTLIASLKSAMGAKKPSLFFHSVIGYFSAKNNKTEPAVTKEEGRFIRQYRWKSIRKKFF